MEARDFSRVRLHLKELCFKKELNRVYQLIGNTTADIIDNISISKQKNQIPNMNSDLNSFLKKYYIDSDLSLSKKIKTDYYKVKISDIKTSFKKYPSLYNPVSLARNIIVNKIEIAEVDKTIQTINFDMHNEICIFPTDDNNILFLVFGQTIREIMDNIIDNHSELKDFRDKYDIQDYHYQNQTDKPEEISDEDWNKRKDDWYTYLPSGVPRIDGMCINITTANDIIDKIFFAKAEEIIKYVPSKEKRVYLFAEEKTINDMLAKSDKDNLFSLVLKYNKMIKNQSPEIMDIYQENFKLFDNILPEITLENMKKGLL